MWPARHWLVLCLVCASAGCSGGGRADLSGEVLLDGEPLEAGTLLLIPTDPTGGTGVSGEIKAGKYSFVGGQALLPGAYKVQIHGLKKTGRKVRDSMGNPGDLVDEVAEAVAPRFNAETELTVEVRPGGGPKNFAVFSR